MEEAERLEHARLLREAIERSGHTRQVIADALGVSVRNVGYWTSKKAPTMPDAGDRAALRKLLGEYDTAGDAVEVAIRRSELHSWRQSDVIATYQRHLHEQARDEVG